MFVRIVCIFALICLCVGAPARATSAPPALETAAAAYAAGDFVQARQLWLSLASQGVAEAQYRLGVLHELGQGVPKHDADAAAWYSMAAANDHLDAKAKMGLWYRDGRSVRKNATRAVLLLYGAAMEGHKEAMQALADIAQQQRVSGRKSSTAVLFGQDLSSARRGPMRETLQRTQAAIVRQDDGYICDVYDVRKAIPGATHMAACYGNTGVAVAEQPLGFVKIDYDAPDKARAEAIKTITAGRFGPPSAGEGSDAALWNLGTVIVATQYAPDVQQVGLMYMVPKVYHLTQMQKGL